jgi:hypothetical protein
VRIKILFSYSLRSLPETSLGQAVPRDDKQRNGGLTIEIKMNFCSLLIGYSEDCHPERSEGSTILNEMLLAENAEFAE